MLIRSGGEARQDTSVSPEVLKNILIQSTYNKTQQSIRQIQFELKQCQIDAPFSGIVSNIQVKPFQHINAGQVLCFLHHPNSFEAVFTLLESEALQVRKGQQVLISPLSLPNTNWKASIVTINPLVNEQGLVKVTAKLQDTSNHRLLEGMNVRVTIEEPLAEQLVIPKSAVVLRTGKPVVFTVDTLKQLAKWNWIEILYENDQQVCIQKGLNAGDWVIDKGNLNLDHDSEVNIQNSIK